MIFKFLSKPLVLHCIVSEEFSHVYDYAPVQPANLFFPQWWRQLAKSRVDWTAGNLTQNIKSCQGIQDHYAHGAVIPMWTEMSVSMNGQGGVTNQFSDMITTNDYQGPDFRGGIHYNRINMKIATPWRMMSDRDVYWHFLPVYWDLAEPEPWEVCPGTLEFYYQHSVNVNLMIDNVAGSINIQHLQPLVHLVPLSERRLKIKNEMVSAGEFNRLANRTRALSFLNKYKTIRRVVRDQDSKSCPFSWL